MFKIPKHLIIGMVSKVGEEWEEIEVLAIDLKSGAAFLLLDEHGKTRKPWTYEEKNRETMQEIFERIEKKVFYACYLSPRGLFDLALLFGTAAKNGFDLEGAKFPPTPDFPPEPKR